MTEPPFFSITNSYFEFGPIEVFSLRVPCYTWHVCMSQCACMCHRALLCVCVCTAWHFSSERRTFMKCERKMSEARRGETRRSEFHGNWKIKIKIFKLFKKKCQIWTMKGMKKIRNKSKKIHILRETWWKYWIYHPNNVVKAFK